MVCLLGARPSQGPEASTAAHWMPGALVWELVCVFPIPKAQSPKSSGDESHQMGFVRLLERQGEKQWSLLVGGQQDCRGRGRGAAPARA